MMLISRSAAPAPLLFSTPSTVLGKTSDRRQATRPQPARRPSPQQGIALEILGHAIEYLADTNFYHQRSDHPAVKEAISILKQSNREVFAEAPEVLRSGSRAARWLRSHLHLQSTVPAPQQAAPPRLSLVKR